MAKLDIGITKIVKQEIPLILVDRYFKDSKIPYITSDNYQGSYDATQQLITHGHKRICLISGSNANELVKDRTNGYIDALKVANIPLAQELIIGDSFSIQNYLIIV